MPLPDNPPDSDADHRRYHTLKGDLSRKVVLTSGVSEAVKKALETAESKDMILVTGSLFVVGEAREAFKRCLKAV